MFYVLALIATVLAQKRCKLRSATTTALPDKSSRPTLAVEPLPVAKTKCAPKANPAPVVLPVVIEPKKKCKPKATTSPAIPTPVALPQVIEPKNKCKHKASSDPVIATKRKCGVKTKPAVVPVTVTAAKPLPTYNAIPPPPKPAPTAAPQTAPKTVPVYKAPAPVVNSVPAPVIKPAAAPVVAAPPPSQYGQYTTQTSGLPANFQSCVDLQNQARKELNLPPLRPSVSLSQSAEAYAQILKQKYGSGPLTLVHSKDLYGNVGENLYANSDTVTCAGAVKNWVTDEKPLYTPGTKIDGPNFHSYGHYTQIVYRQATQVGCSSESGMYYVCHYDVIQIGSEAAF